ncbi:MAG: hypothetical protein KY412_03580 [Actinobacteria bacterium]|nr:hypothetical protein [Actinomycetota bacterium]
MDLVNKALRYAARLQQAPDRHIDISVDPELHLIRQPSPMTCWAAAGTMLKSWQAKKPLSIREVLEPLGDYWREKFEVDEGLSAVELAAFAGALGLTGKAPMRPSVAGLARLLAEHGPLWVVSDDPFEDNNTVHLRVVTAMNGDGTSEGTTVTLADSSSASFVTESFTEFARDLEASDPRAFGAGLYHF